MLEEHAITLELGSFCCGKGNTCKKLVIITEQYPLPRSSLGNCKVDGKFYKYCNGSLINK